MRRGSLTSSWPVSHAYRFAIEQVFWERVRIPPRRLSARVREANRSTLFQFNDQCADLRVADVFALMRDGFAPEYIPCFALEDFRGTVRGSILNPVTGAWIEHILRMAMKTFSLAGFEMKLQNANSIVLKFDSEFVLMADFRFARDAGLEHSFTAQASAKSTGLKKEVRIRVYCCPSNP